MRVPTYDSATGVGGTDIRPIYPDATTVAPVRAGVKAGLYNSLSNLFREYDQEYQQKEALSKRARDNTEVIRIGVETDKYSQQLTEQLKKTGVSNDQFVEEYEKGMDKYYEGIKGKYEDDPALSSSIFESIMRTSITGRHNAFNFVQDRRKSENLANLDQMQQMALQNAVSANTETERQISLTQFKEALSASMQAGYIDELQARKAYVGFANDVYATIVTSSINDGNLGKAKIVLETSKDNLTPKQYETFREKIKSEGEKYEIKAKIAVEKDSRLAQLQMQEAEISGKAYDPEKYYARMSEMDVAEMQVWIAGQKAKEKENVQDFSSFAEKIESGDVVINSQKEKSIADAYYTESVLNNAAVATPDQKSEMTLDFVRKTGYIPTPYADALTSMMRKQSFPEGTAAQIDPAEKAQAARMIDRIRADSPAAYESLPEQTKNFASAIVGNMDYYSYSPEQAVKLTEQQSRLANQDLEAQKILMEAALPEAGSANAVTINNVTEEIFDMTSQSQLTSARLLTQYNDSVKIAIKSGADPELARERAKESLGKKWGITTINGDEELMEYPPEKILNTKASLPLQESVKSFLSNGGVKYDSYKIVSDSVTQDDLKQGRPVTYSVVITDEKGLSYVTDKRWTPSPVVKKDGE